MKNRALLMKRSSRIVPLFGLCGALALAGCSRPTGAGSANGAASGTGPIPVGEYASMTGKTATFGQSSPKGLQMAVDEINAVGGVTSRPLELHTEDDESQKSEAA